MRFYCKFVKMIDIKGKDNLIQLAFTFFACPMIIGGVKFTRTLAICKEE